MYHRKEKRIQEGWKGKINQVGNILNCSTVNPPQCEIRLLVGMGGCLGPFLLDMLCGLSRPSLVWSR